MGASNRKTLTWGSRQMEFLSLGSYLTHASQLSQSLENCSETFPLTWLIYFISSLKMGKLLWFAMTWYFIPASERSCFPQWWQVNISYKGKMLLSAKLFNKETECHKVLCKCSHLYLHFPNYTIITNLKMPQIHCHVLKGKKVTAMHF